MIEKVTIEHVNSVICGEQYHQFDGTTLIICCLTLKNGFAVTGESACARPEIFDREFGEKLARKNAVDKIWMLEGYLLKEMLHQASIEK